MGSLFEIAKSGIQAYRQALAVTGQNIANVNTEGYSKSDVALEEIGGVQGGVTDVSDQTGLGVRVDSCIYNGYAVVPYYDSLIGKLIVHAENRKEAISRMNRSLNELVVDGIDTTKDLHKKIISSKSFKKYDFSINWLEGFLKK